MKYIATVFAVALAGCATSPTDLPSSLSGRPAGMREGKLSDFDFNLPRDYRWACGPLGDNGSGSGKPADCDRLGEAEYFSGTWLADRETSAFSFAGEKNCWDDYKDAVECVDLEMSVEPRRQIPDRAECTNEYRLEFIGRRTLRPVMVGYPSYVIVVDKIISSRRLGFAKPKHNICGRMG